MMLPIYLQCISVSAYYALGGDMSASTIFTALQLFQALQQPLTQFPNSLTQLAQTMTSLSRISEFLKTDEIVPDAKFQTLADERAEEGQTAIKFAGPAEFSWNLESDSIRKLNENAAKFNKTQREKQAERSGSDTPTTTPDVLVDVNEGGNFKLSNLDLEIKQGELCGSYSPPPHPKH